MDGQVSQQQVHIRKVGDVGHITLNRPEALHALTQDMCLAISKALRQWAQDETVVMVLMDHAEGTRGFCAGGDIRLLAQSGQGDGVAGAAFFADEYRMNVLIHDFPKPFVALMDGVTMGGGVGISVHGSHRIVTERTLFAMPETGIGLFPDVGGSWFLSRLKGYLGTWLALTGARLKGGDVVAAGIGTHYVKSEDIAALKANIIANPQALEAHLDAVAMIAPDPSFAEHLTLINTCFDRDCLTNIILALRHADDEWAEEQGLVLKSRSPFSMAVSLKAQRLGRETSDFHEVMRMEYRVASRIIKSHDFLEGVRAVIIDKDHAPKWSPDSVTALDMTEVNALFAPLDSELTF